MKLGLWLMVVAVLLGALPAVQVSAEIALPARSVAVAVPADLTGYWVLLEDGVVEASGGARTHFGVNGFLRGPAQSAVDIAAVPLGSGYWVVSNDGGVFTAGDARFFGSLGGIALREQIVAVASTPTGLGYWLVAADGGVFAFGDAEFKGSLGGLDLDAPIVDIAVTPSGRGYWLAAADGGVFAFGDAEFMGSGAGGGDWWQADGVVAISATRDGTGYRLVTASAIDFRFGSLAERFDRYWIRGSSPIDAATLDGPRILVLNPLGSTQEYGTDTETSRADLAEARIAWADSGIDDYAFVVSGNWSFWCSAATLTTVRDGAVVEFDRLALSTYSGCAPSSITIDDFHDFIETKLDGRAEIAIEYDQNGVPISYSFDIPEVVDEEASLRIMFVETTPGPVPPSPPSAPNSYDAVTVTADDDGDGYWTLRGSGLLGAFEDASWYGNPEDYIAASNRLAVDLAADPSSDGYWIATTDGAVYSYGEARFHGSLGGVELSAEVVAIKATPTGAGYWLTAADGGIFAFGDAAYLGSLAGFNLTAPIVDMAPTQTGRGYWLVGADGGVFAFGDALFVGSGIGLVVEHDSIVAIEGRVDGYTLYSSQGAVAMFSVGTEPTLGYLPEWQVSDVTSQAGSLLVLGSGGAVSELAGTTSDWTSTLEANRQIWNDVGLDDYATYAYVRTGDCPGFVGLASIANGVVADTETQGSSESACALPAMTVEALFDFIANRLNEDYPATVDIEFDERGVPTRFKYDVPLHPDVEATYLWFSVVAS